VRASPILMKVGRHRRPMKSATYHVVLSRASLFAIAHGPAGFARRDGKGWVHGAGWGRKGCTQASQGRAGDKRRKQRERRADE